MNIMNKEITGKAYNLAYKYEQEKEHCSQCALAGILESLNIMDETLFRASDGLTGGTAMSTKGTCGALAAGMLAISTFTGRTYSNFKDEKPGHEWDGVRLLYERFVEKYGGPVGETVQRTMFGRSYILLDKEQREEFVSAGAHRDKCPSVCGTVAAWSVEIILDYMERNNIPLQIEGE